MKHLLHAPLLLALGSLTVLTSCRDSITGEGEVVRENRHLSGFSKVEFQLPGTVEIMQGSTFALAIEAQGNLQSAIETEVKGDELIISTDKNIKTSKPIRILLTMPKLEGVEVDGSGTVTVNDMFEPDHFDLDLSGSGNFKGQFSANEIEATINGSGDVDLGGRANAFTAQINGSGNFRSTGLEAKECKVTINGSGDADITVLERLDVSINGSGDVMYHGNPEHQNTSVNGSGRVTRR